MRLFFGSVSRSEHTLRLFEKLFVVVLVVVTVLTGGKLRFGADLSVQDVSAAFSR